MFFLSKRRVKKRRKKFSPYYFLSALFLAAGMIIGFMNAKYNYVYDLPANADSLVIFKYGIIKNLVLLLIMFLNGFSLAGFPLTAILLIINGYLLSVSTATLYVNNIESKLLFMLDNFPHVGLIIISNLLLSEAVFKFSQNVFSTVIRNHYRSNSGCEFKRLLLRMLLCIIITIISSFYEAFVL